MSTRALLLAIADLLDETPATANGMTGSRDTGTIKSAGHSDIRVDAVDPWVCPHLRVDVNGATQCSHTGLNRCRCELGTVRAVVMGWVRVVVAETDPEGYYSPGASEAAQEALETRERSLEALRGPGATLTTRDAVLWLASQHRDLERHEASYAAMDDLNDVHAALVRVLGVKEADRTRSWLPVEKALAVATQIAPDRVASRATAYRRAEPDGRGGRWVQPRALLLLAPRQAVA